MIHVINGQNDELMDIISDREVLFNSHKQSLENQLEQFDFECLPNLSYADKLTDRNRLIIPSEDEGYIEFIIQNVIKTNDRIEVYTTASYLDLIKAKVIYPITLTDYNATAALSFVTNETEWRPGTVESDALRTITIDTHTNPFTMLKRVANEFDLELRFRTETDGNRVTNRYVDLLDRVGTWDGREVTFGKDLDSIERSEDTSDIYTALLCLGPEGIEGNRLGALIEDEDALRRWGRPDPITGELKHLIGIYEPQSEHLDMTLSDLEQYGRTELNKRINAVITYSANIVDLEHVPGMENKKIRFGDTIRIKDEKFSPPLYVEARVFEQSRDIFENSLKEVKLGDFVEFTEEQVLAIWKQLQAEIKEKISATEMLEYTYDKHTIDDKDDIVFTEGKTFAEAVGIDAKSHADTVSSTAETNAKNYAEDKSAEVLQQALAYAVSQTAYDSKMSEIASDLADKSSVEYVDGQLVDKVNVGDVYTISEIDNALLNKVSVTQYQTDMDGIVQDISVNSTLIGQNQEAIALKANQTDVDALSGKVTDNSAQLTVQAGQISSKVDATYVQGAIADIEVGGRNIILNSDELVNNSGYPNKTYQLSETIKIGMSYTYQIKGQLSEDQHSWLFYSGGTPFGVIYQNEKYDTEKGIYYGTFQATREVNDISIYGFPNSNLNSKIEWIKLEKGNVATDWTPAPEDVQAEIDSVYSYAESEINQLAGRINLKADSTTVDNMNTRLSNAEIDIDALDGAITSKVETSTFNTLKGRVDTAETTITQQANEINLKVNKNGVIGDINLSSEVASINASKINLVGAVTVLSDITGNLGTINAGTINGIDINGVNISGSRITSTSTAYPPWTRTVEIDDGSILVRANSLQNGINYNNFFATQNGDIFLRETGDGSGVSYDYSAKIYLSARSLALNSDSGMLIESKRTATNAYDPVNIVTPYASTQIGPRNSEYSHFKTNASNGFYFYDPVTITGDIRLNGAGRVHNGGDGVTYVQGNTSVRATKYLSGTLTPMYASAFNNGSLASTKTDIKKLNINAIDILKNQAELYSYYLKGDIEDGVYISKMGFVIGEGYKTPFEVLSADGEAVEGYAHSTLNTKAIKELISITDDHADRINFLEMENQILKQRLNQLEGAA